MSTLSDSTLVQLSTIAVMVQRLGGHVEISRDEMAEISANADLHSKFDDEGRIALVVTRRIKLPTVEKPGNC